MNHLKKFHMFEEVRGVAEATLYLAEVLCQFITERSIEFQKENEDQESSESTEEYVFNYDDLEPHLPKKSIYAYFPVSKINFTLLLKKEAKSQTYPFKIGGWAAGFGKKKQGESYFRKGVRKNRDHSISLSMGIDVYVGNFDLESDVNNSFQMKLEAVVLHELNHFYEYYNRSWDPYGRNIQTSVTWASIGDVPENVNKKVFTFWQDDFTYYIYQSEPHEVNAQVQEAKPYVDKLSFEELKKTNIWKNIKTMQNYDEQKFLQKFHEEALSHDPTLIESEVLSQYIKIWKTEYKRLYKSQTEQNNPRPEFFEKMSDGQFMEYWGRKIREAGDRMVRRIIRQYANKEKED